MKKFSNSSKNATEQKDTIFYPLGFKGNFTEENN